MRLRYDWLLMLSPNETFTATLQIGNVLGASDTLIEFAGFI
jgi:hypothetical protein